MNLQPYVTIIYAHPWLAPYGLIPGVLGMLAYACYHQGYPVWAIAGAALTCMNIYALGRYTAQLVPTPAPIAGPISTLSIVTGLILISLIIMYITASAVLTSFIMLEAEEQFHISHIVWHSLTVVLSLLFVLNIRWGVPLIWLLLTSLIAIK